MNAETIKTEIQQVLESELALRKEYNELKRSLSDYRNQLIERDEDCKRLQVNIDVLNTKLMVVERDNTNFKAEVASFTELRSSIKQQLQDKQDEIGSLLSTIDDLTARLSAVSAEYESKMATLSNSSSSDIEGLRQRYEAEMAEFKTASSYQHHGIKSEYEGRINEMTALFEQQMVEVGASYEARIATISSGFQSQIDALKQESESAASQLSSSSTQEIEGLRNAYEAHIESLTKGFITEKETLCSGYESQIAELHTGFAAEKETLSSSYEQRIEHLSASVLEKEQHFSENSIQRLQELESAFAQKEEELKTAYDEKLANMLIHANAQNSKLTEDTNKFVLENEHFKEKIREMVYHIDGQNTQLETLSAEAASKASELKQQQELYATLQAEFEAYRSAQSLSQNDQVTELNSRIESLSVIVTEKEKYSAILAGSLESRNAEYNSLFASHAELRDKWNGLSNSLSEKEETFEAYKNELELNHSQQLQSKEVEFQKLIAENSNLITEIDKTADQLEAAEAELELLKTELAESHASVEGKVQELRDTLNTKNYELSTLSANHSALQVELSAAKSELSHAQEELGSLSEANEAIFKQREEFGELQALKAGLETQVEAYKSDIEQLNTEIGSLNETVASLEEALAGARAAGKLEEQEAFIDRLFKQIDLMNDERMKLLEEKEEMAMQLLKMNDTVSGLSQQVDSQSIDVSELDMHRKNVILAKSSNGQPSTEKMAMKKQINELVREIDKCIALLSA